MPPAVAEEARSCTIVKGYYGILLMRTIFSLKKVKWCRRNSEILFTLGSVVWSQLLTTTIHYTSEISEIRIGYKRF